MICLVLSLLFSTTKHVLWLYIQCAPPRQWLDHPPPVLDPAIGSSSQSAMELSWEDAVAEVSEVSNATTFSLRLTTTTKNHPRKCYMVYGVSKYQTKFITKKMVAQGWASWNSTKMTLILMFPSPLWRLIPSASIPKIFQVSDGDVGDDASSKPRRRRRRKRKGKGSLGQSSLGKGWGGGRDSPRVPSPKRFPPFWRCKHGWLWCWFLKLLFWDPFGICPGRKALSFP